MRARRRRQVFVTGVIVVLLGILGAGAWFVAGREDRRLPPVGEGRADVAQFLGGPGRSLVRFHSMTRTILDLPTDVAEATEACRDLAENEIASVAEAPSELLRLAARVPDRPTAELFMGDVAAKRDALSACVEGDAAAFDRYLDEAISTHHVVERRLDQIASGGGRPG